MCSRYVKGVTMPQDKAVAKYLADIRIEVTALNQYGDVLNEETVIVIKRVIPEKVLSEVVKRFESA